MLGERVETRDAGPASPRPGSEHSHKTRRDDGSGPEPDHMRSYILVYHTKLRAP